MSQNRDGIESLRGERFDRHQKPGDVGGGDDRNDLKAGQRIIATGRGQDALERLGHLAQSWRDLRFDLVREPLFR